MNINFVCNIQNLSNTTTMLIRPLIWMYIAKILMFDMLEHFINRKGTLSHYHTSRPTKGEVLIEKDILTVGSSTLMVGNAFPELLSAIVSPICRMYQNHNFIMPQFVAICSNYNSLVDLWRQNAVKLTIMSLIPQTAHMSPACTCSTGTLLKFS